MTSIWLDLLLRIIRFSFLIYYIATIVFRLTFLRPSRYVYVDLYSYSPIAIFFDYAVDFFFWIDFIAIFLLSQKSSKMISTGDSTAALVNSSTGGSGRRRSIMRRGSNIPMVRRQRGSIITRAGVQLKQLQRDTKVSPNETGDASSGPRVPQVAETLCSSLIININEVLDFISLVPWEAFAYCAGMKNYYVLRSIRLIRLKYFNYYWEHLCELLHELQIFNSRQMQRACFLVIIMAITSHCAACIFYFIGVREIFDNSSSKNWLCKGDVANCDDLENVVFNRDLGYRYLRSLYWSVKTLTTVGLPDVTAHSKKETWFCLGYFYFSVIIIYNVIANSVTLVTSMDSDHAKNLAKKAKFMSYAKYRKLPEELARRVESYYDYQWEILHGLDEAEILSELPPNLYLQVQNQTVREFLSCVPIIRDLNKAILNALAGSVEMYVYSPGDTILYRSANVAGVHIVIRGEVEVVDADNVVIDVLESKLYFGDKSLQNAYAAEFTYRSKSFVEIIYLRGSLFHHICELHMDPSDLKKVIPTIASNRWASVRVLIQKKRSEKIKTERSIDIHKAIIASTNSIKAGLLRENFGHPDSPFRIFWEFILLLGVLFYICSLPILFIYVLFPRYPYNMLGLLIAGYVVDLLFFVDAIFQAKVFAFINNGIRKTSERDIWSNFWANNNNIFYLIFALFPFDIIFGASINLQLIPPLRLLKLLHVGRLMSLVDSFFYTLTMRFKLQVSFEMGRFVTLYTLLFILCHWVACLWVLSAAIGSEVLHSETTWVYNDRTNPLNQALQINFQTPLITYSRALYWGVNTMASLGFPDILASNSVEMVFAIFIMFFGFLFFNTLLGAIVSMISNFNKDRREYNMKVDRMRTLMIFSNIPSSIESKVLRYYEYMWSRFGGVDEKDVLGTLPTALRTEVIACVVGPVVRKIPFFADCSELMEQSILAMFNSRIYLDGDALIISGETGKEMFVIEKGQVTVTSGDGLVVFARLSAGDYIGESSLLEVAVRSASAFAKGYVDTYFITNENFSKLSDKFPVEYKEVVKKIKETIELKKLKNMTTVRQAGIAPDSTGRRKSVRTFNEADVILSAKENNAPGVLKKQLGRQGAFNNVGAEESSKNVISMEVVLHPDSYFRVIWDLLMLAIIIYYVIMIPLRLCIRLKEWLYYIDYSMDVLVLIDCVLTSRYFYVYAGGHLVSTSSVINKHYRKKRLFVDMISSFPYDIFALAVLGRGANVMYFTQSILRIPKVFKVFVVSGFYKQAEHFVALLQVNFAFYRCLEISVGILLIAVWVASGWMMLARYHSCDAGTIALFAPSDLDCRYLGTWVMQQYLSYKLPSSGGGQWNIFLRSMYFSVTTLTAHSISDIVPANERESLYAFFIVFFGLSINGYIIGNIVSLVSDANEETTEIFRRAEQLRHYLVLHQVPQDLVTSSLNFSEYVASAEGSLNMARDVVFSDLPHVLKIEIDKHLKTVPFLRRCPFFDFCSDEVLVGISSRLRVQLYAKGDRIISFGDLGQEMFFLQSGAVDVKSGDEKTLYSTLEQGAFFGETALFFKSPRVATIIAKSPFCLCLILHKSDLDNELKSLEYNHEKVLNAFKNLQNMNKRRNDAVVQNLKLVEDKTSKLHKLIKVSDTENQRTYITKLRKYFHPDSNFRFVWDIVGMLILLYYIVAIPAEVAFLMGISAMVSPATLTIEALMDAYWLVDIVLKLFFFSFRENVISNKLVTDGEMILKRYRSTWLWYDVVASIPTEFLVLIPKGNHSALYLMRVVHLLRAPQINDYFNLMERHLHLRCNLVITRTTSLVIKSGFAYMIINHCLACGYFMIHRYAEKNAAITYLTYDGYATYNPETRRHSVCDNNNISMCYVRSMYLVAMTMTSIGYGDVSPFTNSEVLWQMFVAVSGSFAGAIFCGCCAAFQSDRDATTSYAFGRKLKQLEAYVRFRNLPVSLKDAIVTQFIYLWNKMSSLSGERNKLLTDLSQPCEMEIMTHINSVVLLSNPVLRDASSNLRRRLATKLCPQVLLKDGLVYAAGDVGSCIYFVASGEASVTLCKDKQSLDPFALASMELLRRKEVKHGSVYRKSSHFGEFCLLSKSGLRAETAVSLVNTELYYLNKDELWDTFKYVAPTIRIAFLRELFTRVDDARYIEYSPREWTDEELDGSEVGASLYCMAFHVLEEITEALLQRAEDSDDEGAEGDLDEFKAMIQEGSILSKSVEPAKRARALTIQGDLPALTALRNSLLQHAEEAGLAGGTGDTAPGARHSKRAAKSESQDVLEFIAESSAEDDERERAERGSKRQSQTQRQRQRQRGDSSSDSSSSDSSSNSSSGNDDDVKPITKGPGQEDKDKDKDKGKDLRPTERVESVDSNDA